MDKQAKINEAMVIINEAKIALRYLRINDHIFRRLKCTLQLHEYEENVACLEKDIQDIKSKTY